MFLQSIYLFDVLSSSFLHLYILSIYQNVHPSLIFSWKKKSLYLPHLLSSTLSSFSLPSGWRRSGELLILLFSTLVSLAFTSLSTTSQPLLLLLLFSLQASPCVLKMSSMMGVRELLGLKKWKEAFCLDKIIAKKSSPKKVWG